MDIVQSPVLFQLTTSLIFLGGFLVLFSKTRQECWGWISLGLLFATLYYSAVMFWKESGIDLNPKLVYLVVAISLVAGSIMLLISMRRWDSYVKFLRAEKAKVKQRLGFDIIVLIIAILGSMILGFTLFLPFKVILTMIYGSFLIVMPFSLPHYKEYTEWRIHAAAEISAQAEERKADPGVSLHEHPDVVQLPPEEPKTEENVKKELETMGPEAPKIETPEIPRVLEITETTEELKTETPEKQ